MLSVLNYVSYVWFVLVGIVIWLIISIVVGFRGKCIILIGVYLMRSGDFGYWVILRG